MGVVSLRVQFFSCSRQETEHRGPSLGTLAVIAIILFLLPRASAQDVPFLESPEAVVEAMLDLARVGETDVVYDLGSGDGRIVIAAAASRKARGVGVEIEPELVDLSTERAQQVGVEDLVTFFETDFSEATVLMLYLQPKVNKRLRPLLTEQLAPGTRVVSHRYEFRDWTPVERIKVEGRSIFLYVIP